MQGYGGKGWDLKIGREEGIKGRERRGKDEMGVVW